MLLRPIVEGFKNFLCEEILGQGIEDVLVVLGRGCGTEKFFGRYQGLDWASTFIPLFREISRSSSKCISFTILCTWSEDDFEIVLGEFLGPSSLSAREEGLGREILQVVVVSDDSERAWELVQVHVPFFKGQHDSE